MPLRYQLELIMDATLIPNRDTIRKRPVKLAKICGITFDTVFTIFKKIFIDKNKMKFGRVTFHFTPLSEASLLRSFCISEGWLYLIFDLLFDLQSEKLTTTWGKRPSRLSFFDPSFSCLSFAGEATFTPDLSSLTSFFLFLFLFSSFTLIGTKSLTYWLGTCSHSKRLSTEPDISIQVWFKCP